MSWLIGFNSLIANSFFIRYKKNRDRQEACYNCGMRTIIELPEFYKKAEKLFGEKEREKIVELLSTNPTAGKKLENFGGIHRLEWMECGKKPKEHNIYYHAGSKNLPVVIIGIFRKNEKMILDKIIEILLHRKIN